MMDSNDTDYDMLDLLAWNCTNLMCQLNESESTDTEQSILEKYLKRVDGEFDTITDFKDGKHKNTHNIYWHSQAQSHVTHRQIEWTALISLYDFCLFTFQISIGLM